MSTHTDRSSDVELQISGMTCASCANRIERKLNKLDGVVATVNYATEKAKVTYPEPVSAEDLISTVRKAGYDATLPRRTGIEEAGATDDDPTRSLRNRLIVSTVLAVPVVAMAMVPAFQFTYWQWLSLTLAAPVVVWGAWPFHRAAWVNLRHGTSTMDTLISMGVLAAFGWSVYALFWGTAGTPGMTHPFELTVQRTDGAGNIYLEAAAGVTTFLLAGRYFEARSKRRAGAALRALLELGAKDVAVLREGVEVRIPTDQLTVGDAVRRPPGREGRHRRGGRGGQLRRRRLDADRRVGARRGRSRRPGRRRHGQRRRPARRPGHPGRRRHPAGPDGPAGRGRPERQGAGAAPRRPGLGDLRPDRDRARRRHPRLLDRCRAPGCPPPSPPPSRC